MRWTFLPFKKSMVLHSSALLHGIHYSRIKVALSLFMISIGWVASAQSPDYRESIVYITASVETTRGYVRTESGTGFFVGSEGNILTSYHLIPQFTERELEEYGTIKQESLTFVVVLRSKNGDPINDVNVVDANSLQDFLLLDIDEGVMGVPLCVNASFIATEQDLLISPGFPASLPYKLATGRIISTEGEGGTWVTDLVINPGQSGSPIMLTDGTVIGIAKGQNAFGNLQEPVPGEYIIVPISRAPGIASFGSSGCEDGAYLELSNFLEVLYIGSPSITIFNALGPPELQSRPTEPSEICVGDGDICLEEDAEAMESATAALARFEPLTAVFIRDSFAVEAVFSRDRLVQYSILLKKSISLDLTQLRDGVDLGQFFLSVNSGPVLLGHYAFSEIMCGMGISGEYYAHDSWVRMDCGYSEATNNIETSYFHSPMGSGFGAFGSPEYLLFEDNRSLDDYNLDYVFPIGYNLLNHASGDRYDPQPVCEGDLSALNNFDTYLVEARSLPILDENYLLQPSEKVCLSLRILNPNGIVVRDMSEASDFIVLREGNYIEMGPNLISDGMMTRTQYGSRQRMIWAD